MGGCHRAHQLDRGRKGVADIAHYCAAKHGMSGLMKTLAVELGPTTSG